MHFCNFFKKKLKCTILILEQQWYMMSKTLDSKRRKLFREHVLLRNRISVDLHELLASSWILSFTKKGTRCNWCFHFFLHFNYSRESHTTLSKTWTSMRLPFARIDTLIVHTKQTTMIARCSRIHTSQLLPPCRDKMVYKYMPPAEQLIVY